MFSNSSALVGILLIQCKTQINQSILGTVCCAVMKVLIHSTGKALNSTGLAVWLGCVDTWTSCLLGSVLAEDAFGANQRLVSVPLSTVVNAGYEEQFSEMTSPAGARDMIFWRQVVPCCSSRLFC